MSMLYYAMSFSSTFIGNVCSIMQCPPSMHDDAMGEGTHKSIYMYSTTTIALLPLYAQNGDSDFELCLYGFMSEEGVYFL